MTITDRDLFASSVRLLNTVALIREWRQNAFDDKHSVGFIPTMGALHAGHMSLVQRSLAENDLTVVSIFVNPAQFAPHEDLSAYPRTLARDLELLAVQSSSLGENNTHTVSAVFFPSVEEIFPSGIPLEMGAQKGAFVELKGYQHQMEGVTRPTYLRGVATVIVKLFNVVQPTNAYFGQKDIQQSLFIKRLAEDLLIPHPRAANVHIVPTARDPMTSLALSSRNSYLSADGLTIAPILIRVLRAAEVAWNAGNCKAACIECAMVLFEAEKSRFATLIPNVDGSTELKMDYIEMNDVDSFEVVAENITINDAETQLVILSGSVWVGPRTRLIDNLVLGDAQKILGKLV